MKKSPRAKAIERKNKNPRRYQSWTPNPRTPNGELLAPTMSISRVPRDLLDTIKAMAQAENVSISAVAVRLMRKGMEA